MKKIKLIDSIGKIDDKAIDDVLKIDNIEEYKKKKKEVYYKRSKKVFAFLGVGACAVIAIFMSVLFTNNGKDELSKDNKKSDIDTTITTSIVRKEMTDSLIEVKDTKEMEDYLGFNVPVLDKKIKSYVVIDNNDDNYADIGRIVYEDGSIFQKINKEEQNSSTVIGIDTDKVTIDGIEIMKYQEDNIYYISWEIEEYSYLYSDLNEISSEVLNELIKITK